MGVKDPACQLWLLWAVSLANMARCWWWLLKLLCLPLSPFLKQRRASADELLELPRSSHLSLLLFSMSMKRLGQKLWDHLLFWAWLPTRFWVFPALSLQFSVFLLYFQKHICEENNILIHLRRAYQHKSSLSCLFLQLNVPNIFTFPINNPTLFQSLNFTFPN